MKAEANRNWRRVVCRWLIFLLLLPLIVIGVLMLLENRLVFPLSTAEQSWFEPPTTDYEDVTYNSADGTKLHGWFFPTRTSSDVLVFAHGNGGNVSYWGRRAVNFRENVNVSVLLFEYPGYGKAEGKPSEAGCYAAGDAAIAWLKREKKFEPKQMILCGESLGGGVAVELALRHEHKALILAKTYTSLPAVAKVKMPWLPAHLLMRNRFETITKLPRITTPIFIAHGTADELIPFSHAEENFATANEPKELHRLEGQTHNHGLGSDFDRALRGFLDRLAKSEK